MDKRILLYIALVLGIAAIVMSFTGLPAGYDSEPILAVAVICLSIVGLAKK